MLICLTIVSRRFSSSFWYCPVVNIFLAAPQSELRSLATSSPDVGCLTTIMQFQDGKTDGNSVIIHLQHDLQSLLPTFSVHFMYTRHFQQADGHSSGLKWLIFYVGDGRRRRWWHPVRIHLRADFRSDWTFELAWPKQLLSRVGEPECCTSISCLSRWYLLQLLCELILNCSLLF